MDDTTFPGALNPPVGGVNSLIGASTPAPALAPAPQPAPQAGNAGGLQYQPNMGGVMAAGQNYAKAQSAQDLAGAEAMAQAAEQRSAADHAAVAQARSETKPIPAFVPTKETASDLSMIFGMLGVLGTALGGKAKTAGMEGMAAMTGMMQGYQQGRQDLYEKEYKQFQANLESIKSHNAEIQQELQQALKLSANDMEKGKVYAQLAMARLGAPVLQAKVQYEGVQKAAEWAHQMGMESARLASTAALEQSRHAQAQADARATADRALTDVYYNGRVVKMTVGHVRQLMEQGVDVQPASEGSETVVPIQQMVDGVSKTVLLHRPKNGESYITTLASNEPIPQPIADSMTNPPKGGGPKATSALAQQFNSQVAISINEASQQIKNMTQQQFTTGGVFGKTEGTLLGAPLNALTNSLTNESVQQYNNNMNSLGFELAKIMQGGRSVTKGMVDGFTEGLLIKSGDKPFTVLEKLANLRQKFEKAIEVKLVDSTPEMKPIYENALKQIQESIPFSVTDVLHAQQAKRSNKSATFEQYMAKTMPPKGANQTAPTQKSKSQPGEEVHVDAQGNHAVLRNGQWVEVE